MAPSKKKFVREKPETVEETNATPLSRWQAKYQLLAECDPPESQNGTSEDLTDSTGVVDDYDSDSDIETPAPAKKTVAMDKANTLKSAQPERPNTPWSQCFDQTTGYPYYWNQLTNQVSWEPPPEYVAALLIMKKQALALADKENARLSEVKASIGQKPKKKYPWEGSSESEDEKIEMITTFGPQSEDESEEEQKIKPQSKKRIKIKLKGENKEKAIIGPQLPSSRLNDELPDTYETSSLMSRLVADVGPPGDELYLNPTVPGGAKGTATAKSKYSNKQETIVVHGSGSSDSSDSEDILSRIKSQAKLLETIGGEVPSDVKELITVDTPKSPVQPVKSSNEKSFSPKRVKIDTMDVDDIIAEIVKDIPCIHPKKLRRPSEKSSSFALIASYGDDSDGEDTPKKEFPEPKPLFPSAVDMSGQKTMPLFPSSVNISDENTKTLFPSVIANSETKPCSLSPINESEIDQEIGKALTPPPLDPYESEAITPKAFKRKKRIDLSGIRPIVCSSEPSAGSVGAFQEAKTCYNMDPTGSEKRGFGFLNTDQAEHKPSPNEGAISFIKGETIFQQTDAESYPVISIPKYINEAESKHIEETASLLKDKVTFLTQGTNAVSAIQTMAIQLETLINAWQGEALTPKYLSKWMTTIAAELTANEQSAAPQGWTCTWDRFARRYSYRNTETGTVVWDYPEEDVLQPPPNQASEATSVDEDNVEMELSVTPPRVPLVPIEEKIDEEIAPPSPPIISSGIVTPPPPPPPMISKVNIKKGKRAFAEVNTFAAEKSPESIIIPLPPEEDYPTRPPEPEEPPPPGVDDMEFATMATPSRPSTKPPSSNPFTEVDTKASASAVIETPTLLSELDSFYSDLAMMNNDEETNTENEIAIENTASSSISTKSLDGSSKYSPKRPESIPDLIEKSQEPPTKRKKRVKLTAGFTLQKKGVPSLVAKWQQVQDEARRKYNSDSDEGHMNK